MTTAALTTGCFPNITAEEYHADPVEGGSLSSTGARDLLPPSCPALFRWKRDNPQPHKPAFDLGHAAHRHVLNDGADIIEIDAPDWRTKAAKAERDEAHEAGNTPLLSKDVRLVEKMAAAIRRDDIASALFNPEHGQPEQTLIWHDELTGVTCRVRLDWLPNPTNGRLIIPDYKSCHSAEPQALRRSIGQFGYHQQADFYLTAAKALGLAGDDAAFLFVCQEKTPPYLVTVVELDGTAMKIAAARNRWARETYAYCTERDQWPSYVDGIAHLALPAWTEIEQGADIL